MTGSTDNNQPFLKFYPHNLTIIIDNSIIYTDDLYHSAIRMSDPGHHNDDNVPHEAMNDITHVLEDAASFLNFKMPMLHTESFNLQDSMAALEIMDKKMDCCEVPCRNGTFDSISESRSSSNDVGSDGEELEEENSSKMVFPRPAPTGLFDFVDPLPWEELTMDDAAFIAIENIVLLESFLTDGTSVVENTFTCLYAHKCVVEDMKNRLGHASLTDKMQAMMYSMEKGTVPQHVVYLSTLMLIKLTEFTRDVILNADIYEEEDFTVNTHNICIHDDQNDVSVIKMGRAVLNMLKEGVVPKDQCSNTKHHNDVALKAINLILEFQVDLLSIITSLSRLSGKCIKEELLESQALLKSTVAKITEILALMKNLKELESESTRLVIKRSFDPYVNRPLVGNAPLRKIVFRNPDESFCKLKTIIKEMDSVVCNILLKGNTIGRIRCMMRNTSASSANILTRSLLVLNLYFDDKMFGQYFVAELIVNQMKQITGVSDDSFSSKTAQTFLNRLCKPVYDTLKVQVLNKNRQRSYYEIILNDWADLREEAYIVDMTYRQEGDCTAQLQPYFSRYILSTTTELMDNFVSLGVELELICGQEELSTAYWYRDFLIGASLSQINTMRQTKTESRRLEQEEELKNKQCHQSANKHHKNKKKKGKNKKNSFTNNIRSNNGDSIIQSHTAEDIEEDFDVTLVNVKQSLCKGLVRFFAAVRQAGIVQENCYEFTTNQRIFEMRFEVFANIQQPPPLSFEDYLKGSDFSQIHQKELLETAGDMFSFTKSLIDQLLKKISFIDSDYLPAKEEDIRQLAKVCVGNSVYLRKLERIVDSKEESQARITIDTKASKQFCTIKID